MNTGAPYMYNQINAYSSIISPSNLHTKNTALYNFFERYLWEDLYGVIKYTIPKNWSMKLFKWCLYVSGVCAVINTDKFGVIPQPCTLGGRTVMYQPALALISNPLIGDGHVECKIGLNCEIITPNDDYGGFCDLVSYYADLMSITAESFGMNVWNSKLAYMFISTSKGAAKTFQEAYDKIQSGEPAVTIDKDAYDSMGNLKWQLFDTNIGSNYIAEKLLLALNRLIDNFHTDIGIPNANTDKKERLVSAEVDINSIEVRIKMDNVLDNIKDGLERVRQMFNIPRSELDAEWRYAIGTISKPTSNVQPQSRFIQ